LKDKIVLDLSNDCERHKHPNFCLVTCSRLLPKS